MKNVLMLVLAAFVFLSCGGGAEIDKIKSFKVGSTTLGKLLDGAEVFKSTEWSQTEDKQGRKFVIFQGQVNPNLFVERFNPGNGWGDNKAMVEKNGKKLIKEGSFCYKAAFEYNTQVNVPETIESKMVSTIGGEEFTEVFDVDEAVAGQLYTGGLERKIKDLAFDMIKF